MQRRACERIPVSISARLIIGNMFYTGEITNISKMGMFIETKQFLPPQSLFNILVYHDTSLLQFFVRTRWIRKENGVSDGVGVEILNPSTNYLKLCKQ